MIPTIAASVATNAEQARSVSTATVCVQVTNRNAVALAMIYEPVTPIVEDAEKPVHQATSVIKDVAVSIVPHKP